MLSHEPAFITCYLCGLQQRLSTYYKNHLQACTRAWMEDERLLVAELVNGDYADNGLRPEVSCCTVADNGLEMPRGEVLPRVPHAHPLPPLTLSPSFGQHYKARAPPPPPKLANDLAPTELNEEQLAMLNDAASRVWKTESQWPCPNCKRGFNQHQVTKHLRG